MGKRGGERGRGREEEAGEIEGGEGRKREREGGRGERREREREGETLCTVNFQLTFSTHCLYSGNCLYLSNSASHSASERGGFIPFSRCHWVIDRPDSVSLVTPPTNTAPPTKPQQPMSHQPTALLPLAPLRVADEAELASCLFKTVAPCAL